MAASCASLANQATLVSIFADDAPPGLQAPELALTLSRYVLDSQIRVIAHSWGTVRLLAALQRLPGLTATGYLVAPVPTTWSAFCILRDRALAQLPSEVVTLLATPGLEEFSDDQVAAMLPTYMSPQANGRPRGLRFNVATYRRDLTASHGYDVRSALGQICGCTIVLGNDDFVQPGDVADLIDAASSVINVRNAGHFVLDEQPGDAHVLLHALV
ncbi:MAG: alpha/beta hydrolase [Hyphomicrobium sp.]